MKNNAYDMYKNDKPEKHTGYLIWQVSNVRQRIINNDLKKIDLTYPQFVIISGIQWLKRSNEIINQVKLIHFTKMDKSVVSSVLKSLEKRDIVIREIDQMDTRAKKLELSEIGSSKLEKALILINKIDEVFFNQNKFDIEYFNKVLIQIIKEHNKGEKHV